MSDSPFCLIMCSVTLEAWSSLDALLLLFFSSSQYRRSRREGGREDGDADSDDVQVTLTRC